MTLKLQVLSPLLCLVVAFLVSGCGNKGELFLVPDEITQQDLLRLEQALEAENALTDGTGTEQAGDDEDDENTKKDKTDNAPSN